MSELSNKGLPAQLEVEHALLQYLISRPNGVRTAVVYKELAEIMHLSGRQLQAIRDSDGRNLWQNLVRYAYRRLKDNDLVIDGPRGLWKAKGVK